MGVLTIWDAASGDLKQKKEVGKATSADAVAFSPDGKTIATGSLDKLIRLWDAENAELRQTFAGHRSVVESLVFSPDGKTIVSGSNDGTIMLWDTASGKIKRTIRAHNQVVSSVALSPDGRMIVSVGKLDKTVKIWRME